MCEFPSLFCGLSVCQLNLLIKLFPVSQSASHSATKGDVLGGRRLARSLLSSDTILCGKKSFCESTLALQLKESLLHYHKFIKHTRGWIHQNVCIQGYMLSRRHNHPHIIMCSAGWLLSSNICRPIHRLADDTCTVKVPFRNLRGQRGYLGRRREETRLGCCFGDQIIIIICELWPFGSPPYLPF